MARKRRTFVKHRGVRYPLVSLQEGGSSQTFVAITPDQLDEATSPRQEGLVKRFTGLFRRSSDSGPDPENTTEMGTGAGVSEAGTAASYYEQTKIDHKRRARIRDYRRMEAEDTILSRALDIRVKNIFMSKDGDKDSYEVTSKVPKVQEIADDQERRLDLQRKVKGYMRTALHLGDAMPEKVYDGAKVMVRTKWLDPERVRRNEDAYGRLVPAKEGYAFHIVDDGDQAVVKLFDWQVAHLRHDYREGNRYGTSIFYTSRRPYRILQAMEDGVAIQRLTRSGDKLVYYVPVPARANKKQIKLAIKEAKTQLKRRSNVSSAGDLEYNRRVASDDEDLFVATHPDNPARVERLSTPGIIGQLADLEYFQRLKVMGPGVPPSYLGLERDVNAKATLSWQDINFARDLRGDQMEGAWLRRDFLTSQLDVLGIDYDDDTFKIVFPPISFVDERMKLEVLQIRWNIAVLARSSLGMPLDWLLQEVLGLDEDTIADLLPRIEEPSHKERAQQAAKAGGMPTQEPGVGARERVKEAVFADERMVESLLDMRAKIDAIYADGLNQSVAA